MDVGDEVKVNDEWHLIGAIFPTAIHLYRITDNKKAIANREFIDEYYCDERPPKKRICDFSQSYTYVPFTIGDAIYYFDRDDYAEVRTGTVRSGVFVSAFSNKIDVDIVDDESPLEIKKVNAMRIFAYDP